MSELIVMLTYDDFAVKNASEVFIDSSRADLR